MSGGYTDRKVLLALLMLALIFGPIVLYWYGQAVRMQGDFRKSLQAGRVESLPPALRDKTWTEEELRTVKVLTLVRRSGRRRGAALRLLYTRGDVIISENDYRFQAKITDLETGIRYVFGYRRSGGGGWTWASVDPETMQLYIDRYAVNPPV